MTTAFDDLAVIFDDIVVLFDGIGIPASTASNRRRRGPRKDPQAIEGLRMRARDAYQPGAPSDRL